MIPLSFDDIHFAQPWAFVFVLVTILSPLFQNLLKALSKPSAQDVEFVSHEMRDVLYDEVHQVRDNSRSIDLLFWLCAVALSLALTRPQWGVIEQTVQQKGLDIVIAIDLSSSMRADDIKPSRIENARRELAFLVEELHGNRIGLVGFAGSAFLFCPLTLDTDAVELFLGEMKIEAVPVPGTALGDAIRTGLETFKLGGDVQSGSKVLLLLTDGEDHQSSPIQAAKEAETEGVIIDTIGLGTAAGSLIPDETGGTIRDQQGNPVLSKLDGTVLKEISETTGGVFLRLDESDNGLSSYLKTLKNREKRNFGETTDVRRHERFPYFLVLAAICFLSGLLLAERDKRQ